MRASGSEDGALLSFCPPKIRRGVRKNLKFGDDPVLRACTARSRAATGSRWRPSRSRIATATSSRPTSTARSPRATSCAPSPACEPFVGRPLDVSGRGNGAWHGRQLRRQPDHRLHDGWPRRELPPQPAPRRGRSHRQAVRRRLGTRRGRARLLARPRPHAAGALFTAINEGNLTARLRGVTAATEGGPSADGASAEEPAQHCDRTALSAMSFTFTMRVRGGSAGARRGGPRSRNREKGLEIPSRCVQRALARRARCPAARAKCRQTRPGPRSGVWPRAAKRTPLRGMVSILQ